VKTQARQVSPADSHREEEPQELEDLHQRRGNQEDQNAGNPVLQTDNQEAEAEVAEDS